MAFVTRPQSLFALENFLLFFFRLAKSMPDYIELQVNNATRLFKVAASAGLPACLPPGSSSQIDSLHFWRKRLER